MRVNVKTCSNIINVEINNIHYIVLVQRLADNREPYQDTPTLNETGFLYLTICIATKFVNWIFTVNFGKIKSPAKS